VSSEDVAPEETQAEPAEGAASASDATATPRDDSDTEGAEPEKGKKKQRPFWKELPILIVVALALAMVIKTFAVQAFYIPSGSMENTLRIGDRVLVNKIVYHTRSIHRGDIIVFNGKGSWGNDGDETSSDGNWFSKALGFVGLMPSGTDYIKRVIGLPGDVVSCAGGGAPVLVNGHPLSESSYIYTDPLTHKQDTPSDNRFGPVTVPKGDLWVMGDHRGDSYDSREHTGDPGGGAIPESEVVGRAFVVIWPIDHWTFLNIPSTFDRPLSAALLPATPMALGLAGALPVTLLWRRRRLR
jgi:signal peptidase I